MSVTEQHGKAPSLPSLTSTGAHLGTPVGALGTVTNTEDTLTTLRMRSREHTAMLGLLQQDPLRTFQTL